MQALLYTLAPVLAVVLGAIVASRTKLKPGLVAGLQHLAAGVVFAAAATEILPQVKHEASPSATLIGGAAGVATMLGLKALEARFKGLMALLAAIGIDILVDGLVLGLAFVAGEKAGLLLTIALTLEVLFLGLTLTDELAETYRSRLRIIVIVSALALLLPIGALAAVPVAALSPRLEQVVVAQLVEVVGRPPGALHRDEQPDEEAARERDEVLGVHDRRADRGR